MLLKKGDWILRITDIQPQKTHKSKVNIFLDGSFAFGMFAKDAAALQLRVDLELTQAQLDHIKQTVLLRQAKETALSLLSRRDYTCRMMWEKLMQKQIPGDVIQQTIAFLEEYHYLDDEAYANRYVKYHSQTRGRHRLRQELMQKGVSEHIVEGALCGLQQEDSLYHMAQKKIQALPEGYGVKELQRLKNYFWRRGFSYDEINECFRKLTAETE